ncbi:MAG TPA: ABC transporter substrate-binding protein [Jiangellaceae bacterium]|nr:ABC transporter substrate-binding protein [Jiangellaceae bacterium]
MATSAIRRPRRLAAAAAALATAAATVALGAPNAHADDTDDTADTTTLTIAVAQEVDSLSPFLAVRLITTNMHRWMYDFLTNYDPETGESIPALAESWDTSEDGLTWTYHINQEATWTDGEDVTAQDVEWTFTTMMTDEAAATANGNFVENFESVTATDDDTVEIKLKSPQVTMLALDVPILPKHKWEGVDDFSTFNNDDEFPIVGNGPWILTEHDVNQSITFEANPDYWRGAPQFDKLVLRYIEDPDAQVEALKSGEVDFVSGLTPAQFESLKDVENIALNQAKGKRFQGFTLNPGAQTQGGETFGDGHPALQDPVVREAIVRTVDREALYQQAYGGLGEPNGALIPSRYDLYHWQPEDIGQDIDEANRLLDEAGYTMGSDGVRVSPDGQPLSFRFDVHADNPQYLQVGQMMAEWASDAGIELDVRPSDDIGGLLDAGTFDLLATGWSVNPDPDFILTINLCSGLPAEIGAPYLSDTYYCNEQYDELYAEQLAELDPDARIDIVKEMQEVLYDDFTFVVWGYADMLEAYRSDVIAEMTPQPDPGGNYWGQDGYWSWWSAVPVAAESAADDGGSGAGVGIGIGAAVVVLGGAGAFLIRRRQTASGEDRE